MSRHFKIWAALSFLLALPAVSWGQASLQKSANLAAGQSGVDSAGQAGTPNDAPPIKPTPADQMTNIPYFTLRDGMNSTLTLNNTAPFSMPVTVSIYNMQGRVQVLPPITVDSHSFKLIEMRDVVASDLFDSGNLQISYQGIPMAVTSQLSV
jgi:hypothetical protein